MFKKLFSTKTLLIVILAIVAFTQKDKLMGLFKKK